VKHIYSFGKVSEDLVWCPLLLQNTDISKRWAKILEERYQQQYACTYGVEKMIFSFERRECYHNQNP